jgi:biopolymer transport protein ExbD
MMSRLRERRSRHHDPAQLNLTPLIDVLFNLLIFVLATASIAAVGELPIDLPGSATAGEGSPDPVVVSVGVDLSLAVGGAGVTLEGLEEAVALALGSGPQRGVVVRADRSVPTGVLVDVYDAAARAGAERIALAADAMR